MRNERLLFTCQWLNAIATCLVAGSVFGPLVFAFGDPEETSSLTQVLLVLLSMIWFGTGVKIHLIGRSLLSKLC